MSENSWEDRLQSLRKSYNTMNFDLAEHMRKCGYSQAEEIFINNELRLHGVVSIPTYLNPNIISNTEPIIITGYCRTDEELGVSEQPYINYKKRHKV